MTRKNYNKNFIENGNEFILYLNETWLIEFQNILN